jgi:ribosomal protein S18 acetylase RimI-like enzyme
MAGPVVWRREVGSRAAVLAPQVQPPGIRLGDWQEEALTPWLELHQEAFLPPGAPRWTPRRFAREFTDRSWWTPQRMVVASLFGPRSRVVGAVAWTGPVEPVMTLNWLAVRRVWRRRGIARALVAEAERRVAAAGARFVQAETWPGWESAMRFYQKLGYARTDELPPLPDED